VEDEDARERGRGEMDEVTLFGNARSRGDARRGLGGTIGIALLAGSEGKAVVVISGRAGGVRGLMVAVGGAAVGGETLLGEGRGAAPGGDSEVWASGGGAWARSLDNEDGPAREGLCCNRVLMGKRCDPGDGSRTPSSGSESGGGGTATPTALKSPVAGESAVID
jgi:hypothetical protein